MNCKPGDLAIVVNCRDVENIGALVEVMHFCGDGKWVVNELSDVFIVRSLKTGERTQRNKERTLVGRDDCLRPLRDNDGQDETLTWAPLPVKTNV